MISLPPGLRRQEGSGNGQTMSTMNKEGPAGTVPLGLLHSTTHTHYSFINSLKNVIVRVFSLKIKRDVHCLCHIVTKNGT